MSEETRGSSGRHHGRPAAIMAVRPYPGRPALLCQARPAPVGEPGQREEKADAVSHPE